MCLNKHSNVDRRFKNLFVIPVRKYSRRLPDKSLRVAGGKRIIDYTLEVAVVVSSRDDVCIATDDPRLVEIAAQWGIVSVLEPEIPPDGEDIGKSVHNCLLERQEIVGEKYDAVVLMHPTQPFRSVSLAERCLQKQREYNPRLVLSHRGGKGCGSFYIVRSESFPEDSIAGREVFWPMGECDDVIIVENTDSFYVDIDTEEDLREFELLKAKEMEINEVK